MRDLIARLHPNVSAVNTARRRTRDATERLEDRKYCRLSQAQRQGNGSGDRAKCVWRIGDGGFMVAIHQVDTSPTASVNGRCEAVANGRKTVSKTGVGGSIPSWPAK